MVSRLDTMAADDFERAYADLLETVIRRIGGRADRTEEVQAAVELDSKAAQFAVRTVDDQRGQRVERGGLLDIPATQSSSRHDTWVVRDQVYQQVGDAIGSDGGSQTVVVSLRRKLRGREPNVSGGR